MSRTEKLLNFICEASPLFTYSVASQESGLTYILEQILYEREQIDQQIDRTAKDQFDV